LNPVGTKSGAARREPILLEDSGSLDTAPAVPDGRPSP
jgi:hypothetical protein